MTAQTQPVPSPQPASNRPRLTQVLARYGVLLVLLLMIAALSILSPIIRGDQTFLTASNLSNVLLQASVNMIVAVGMTYVITSGGIDLSVGSMLALGAVLAALFMRDFTPAFAPIARQLGLDEVTTGRLIAIGGLLVAVIICALCGLVNGLLIALLNLPPFIATLGTLGMFRGLAMIVTNGRPVIGFGRDYLQMFSYRAPTPFLEPVIVNIPIQIVIALVVAAIFAFVLNRTRLGKYTIAIGGNEETTRLAGIPVRSYKIRIYVLSGLLTGIASALLLARLGSGDPTYGQSDELDAIAATVMGGTSLTGGEGTIAGTVVGALIISLVRNGLNLFNVQSYWQSFVIGAVIVLAVLIDRWRKRQTRRQ
jgi:ribose transport system permease protein